MNSRINKKINKIKSYNIFSEDEIKKVINFSSAEIFKIFKWKKCAEDAGVNVDISDYKNNESWNNITSLYDIKYYETKYSKYDYQKIYNFSKSELIKKKGSMYDPENIAKKKGITIEEAIKISEDRKQKTKITEENLIKKYGKDIGKKRYKDFVEKSKSTIDNYKERYGENWKEKWNYFLSTRDSSSLQYHISKYGEDGERIFSEQVLKFKKSSDLNYYKETYGEENGRIIFDEINAKKALGSVKSWSFNEFILKNKDKNLSKEELKSLFDLKMKKRSSKTIEYFLQKGFSLEDAKDLRLKSIEKLYRNSDKNSPVSKESIRLFSKLESELNRKCKFGEKKEELSLKTNNRLYFYDFFDQKTNTIIEYNGSLFHAPEKLSQQERFKWKNKYGLSWDEVNKKDNQKIDAARAAGYNIIVVWDYEVRSKAKLIEKIKDLVSILGRTNES